LLPSVEKLEVYVGGELMKHLMYLIPLSAIAVLVFAAIAAAQPAAVPGETTTPAQTTTPAESTTTAPNSPTTVDISNNAFNPAQLNVAPGTTVRFVNNDTVPHTATADNGAFDTGELQPGYSMDVFLDGEGTVPYHCELHPELKGSIVVGEAGQASDAGESGGAEEGTNPPNQAVSVYP
jgi:plastocyanin